MHRRLSQSLRCTVSVVLWKGKELGTISWRSADIFWRMRRIKLQIGESVAVQENITNVFLTKNVTVYFVRKICWCKFIYSPEKSTSFVCRSAQHWQRLAELCVKCEQKYSKLLDELWLSASWFGRNSRLIDERLWKGTSVPNSTRIHQTV